MVMVLLAVARLLTGKLDEATLAIDAAEESALFGPEQPLMWARAVRCWLCMLRGDLPAAMEAGEHALEVAAKAPAGLFRWFPHCTLAAARIEAGQPELGRDRILTHAGGHELTKVEPGFRTKWWATLADAELSLGRLEPADAWIRRAEMSAAGLGLRSRTGEAKRVGARLALARGEAPRAADLATEAAELFGAVNQRIDAARSRILAGQALVQAGERRRAAAELEEAHAELAACGAGGYRDEAAAELRRLGRRVASDGAGLEEDGLAALSAREREVSALVAKGLTNRRIGQELYLSEKTVERHLSRIFRKLGLSSRATLAAMVARRPEYDQPEGGGATR